MEYKVFNGMNYWVYTPANAGANKPLVIFLHGAGERGGDPERIFNISLPKWLKNGKWTPDAYVLCPQCPEKFDWNSQVERLKSLIDYEVDFLKIDTSRISITGLSMGGFGTWAMGIHYPDFFSAMAPVCGGGLSWRASNVKDIPIWAFHGEKDEAVPLKNSVEMVDAVIKAGGNPRLYILHNVGHACWDEVYSKTDVLDWLVSQQRQGSELSEKIK